MRVIERIVSKLWPDLNGGEVRERAEEIVRRIKDDIERRRKGGKEE